MSDPQSLGGQRNGIGCSSISQGAPIDLRPVLLVSPEKAPPRVEMLREFIGLLAISFGISNVEMLTFVVSRALEAASKAQDGGPAVAWVDGRPEPTSIHELDRIIRIMTLINDLTTEIEQADFPAGKSKPSQNALFTLRSYMDYLCSVQYRTLPKPGQNPSIAHILTLRFSAGWPILTGEKPAVWKDHYSSQPGGRFLAFLFTVCGSFGIRPPSISSVNRWTADRHSKPAPEKA